MQGPNPRFEPTNGHHWFDGSGMIHYVRLRGAGNSAEYGCRFVKTRGFEEEQAAGKRVHVSLTKPPKAASILRGMVAKGAHWRAPDSPYWVIQSANNANNGVKFHAGRLLATYEAGSAYEVELGRQMRTLGVCSFGGSWGPYDHWTENFSAHAKLCSVTGELVYIGYNLVPFQGPPTVTVGVVSPAGAVAHRVTVPVSRPSMQHDFGITSTRTVLLDGPLVFNLDKSIAGGRPFDFQRGEPLRFGILPRYGAPADCVWIDAECGFAYHVVNCWDDPGDADRVVVILCRMRETRALGMADSVQRHPNGQVGVSQEGPEAGPFVEEGFLHRYVLDVQARRVVESAPLCAIPSDFPCVHPARVGRPTRFAYAAGERSGTHDSITMFDALLKHDLASGDLVRRPLPQGTLCGDVAFAPATPRGPVPVSDDDGHVLLLTHVLAEDRAELLVLDGRDILAPPVAVVHIPVRVPFGFHCEWVAGPLSDW